MVTPHASRVDRRHVLKRGSSNHSSSRRQFVHGNTCVVSFSTCEIIHLGEDNAHTRLNNRPQRDGTWAPTVSNHPTVRVPARGPGREGHPPPGGSGTAG